MTNHVYSANVYANGIRQHYMRFGKTTAKQPLAPAVILLPGITSPAITWAFVAERLSEALEVYVLDIRGRGLSEASDTLDYSLDAQAADVIEFAQALKLDNYTILGHSMGARIGIRAARAHPPGLAKLALVDPPMSGPKRRPYPMQLSWYIESIKKARLGIDAEAMRQYCPTWPQEHLRLRAEWLHTCDERAIIASFDGFGTDDIHSDLPHIRVPSLLMTAGRGDVVQPDELQEFSTLLPGLTHRHVKNAGHMIPWDDENGFYEALGEFLGAAIP
ncbi:alpha/beta fold hydrolase [Eoetvoesiella caeni]